MAQRIRITGLVQGVGFRPNVWRLARACGIAGTVRNDSSGVLIDAWGSDAALADFQQQLRTDIPPLARLDSLQVMLLDAPCPHDDFRIIASESGEIHTGVVADAAMCPACRADIFDASNRRYRYPFTNCTHCGPRLSIVRTIPYDRANTSMAEFAQCPDCLREYTDPADRRFHAQPNACPTCGPSVWLEDMAGQGIEPTAAERDCIDTASRLLREGCIIALMGLGGVHLVCDATNETAVATLRQRKRRYQKPLALMARDTEVIRQYCYVSDAEAALLQGRHAPIVLLERKIPPIPSPSPARGEGSKRQESGGLSCSLTPCGGGLGWGVSSALNTLGFMLPYTPLHALLLESWDTPLIMTSANLSEEPQCITIVETRQRMQGIADYLLLHNRPIVNRVDDSVARILAGKPRLLRRARGYAPEPLTLPAGFANAPPLLAMGGELKNTFALLRDGQAILSQHLGDLEDARTGREYTHTLRLYRDLFQHQPQAIVVDKHPGYRSTQLGQQWAREQGLPLIEVQHHHAHVAACMAENGWPVEGGKVLGILLDGLGYGDDGTLWGGEFLLADYSNYERVGHFKPVAMPGGTQAILQPWRNTWAHLQALGWSEVSTCFADLELIQYLQQQPLATLETMLTRGLNSPSSSSCGRLFDAVAAALDCSRDSISYEGQAAIELEALTPACLLNIVPAYPFALAKNAAACWEIDPAPLWFELLKDLQTGYCREAIAAQFHQGLIHIISELAQRLWVEYPEIKAIALSGGVFQNAILFNGISQRLQGFGQPVLTHQHVPTNDGGIALGQAVIGAMRQKQAYYAP
ncbi:carbamoyltransferase HypF [Thiothrix subterranea]|uniref:Carbamoyltransferase HypF n=1 Tax=Thiothrix subterranea TaxID=2735563 RepID=A0AA51R4A2_9GAMM|nr:carbamoyltransferase HypF [Thiothrix subterranea]MDQ5768868.1 carbamoyltransferase HypF [Thiothrix subterranea]WML86451.1 carbamoyltransferase HypF [Thiothrix subterranea]